MVLGDNVIMYLELLIPSRTHLMVSNAAVCCLPFHRRQEHHSHLEVRIQIQRAEVLALGLTAGNWQSL